MDIVVLLSVLAIALTEVVARPADTEDYSTTKKGKAFKFTLPAAVQHDFGITIKGKLDMSHKNFNFMLPIEGGDKEISCLLNYNYKNKIINISPVFEEAEKTQNYSLDKSEIKDRDFVLYLTARENNGIQMFDLQFEDVHSGLGPMATCMIESFDKLQHIMFREGVKKINSIHFTF